MYLTCLSQTNTYAYIRVAHLAVLGRLLHESCFATEFFLSLRFPGAHRDRLNSGHCELETWLFEWLGAGNRLDQTEIGTVLINIDISMIKCKIKCITENIR